MREERNLGLVHGFLFWKFVGDLLVAFRFVNLIDDFKSDLVALLGIGLPVVKGAAIFWLDDLIENVFIHLEL